MHLKAHLKVVEVAHKCFFVVYSLFYMHKNPPLHTNVLTQLTNLVSYRKEILKISVSISDSGFIASFLLGPYPTGCS